jgi:biotin/methionine sulfoxide reductase
VLAAAWGLLPCLKFAEKGSVLTNNAEFPLTSFHWGTYRVEVHNNEVVALHPFEEDPDPSSIGQGYVSVLNGPDRITDPMVRKSWLEGGPGTSGHLRGREDFVEVSLP